MNILKNKKNLMLFILSMASFFLRASMAKALIIDHNAVQEFDRIPDSYFTTIRDNYNTFYGHTSHGSQIITGLKMLTSENSSLYDRPTFREESDDLGHNGDISWVGITESFLDGHPLYNTVMWSWCGGVSDNTESGINTYLNAMNELESDYPNVTFIYMTGHLDGTGIDGNLRERNDQIREYCENNNKVLFDFADIERHDLNGIDYPDEEDDCNWCYIWCNNNPCPSCLDCSHSHCLNCYNKGKAFWTMMARLAGWDNNGSTPPIIPGDLNSDGILDIEDLFLVARNYGKTIGFDERADANNDGVIDISDLFLVARNYGT